jgi:hypothetical protein
MHGENRQILADALEGRDVVLPMEGWGYDLELRPMSCRPISRRTALLYADPQWGEAWQGPRMGDRWGLGIDSRT